MNIYLLVPAKLLLPGGGEIAQARPVWCLVSGEMEVKFHFPAACAASFIHPASVFIVPGGVGAFICLATLATPRSYFTAVTLSYHHLISFVFCCRQLIQSRPVRLTRQSGHHVIVCTHLCSLYDCGKNDWRKKTCKRTKKNKKL